MFSAAAVIELLFLTYAVAASVLLLSKRSFYVLSLDIIFVPFAGAVLMLEQPFFDGGR